MAQFVHRRRRNQVEAIQFLPDHLPWPRGVQRLSTDFYVTTQGTMTVHHYGIFNELTGDMDPVFEGDWIVFPTHGTPVRRRNFEMNFESTTGPQDGPMVDLGKGEPWPRQLPLAPGVTTDQIGVTENTEEGPWKDE